MTFKSGAVDEIQRKRAGMHALLQHLSAQLESYAKTHASWNDRTSHARQAIHSGVEKNQDLFIMYLSHGVGYGQYLEEGTGLHGPYGKSYSIKPKNKKALYWFGASHPVKEVKNHPGMKARPIIDPTIDANIAKMNRHVRQYWEAT